MATYASYFFFFFYRSDIIILPILLNSIFSWTDSFSRNENSYANYK